MRRLMLLALVALFGLLLFAAVDALAVPPPLFAKVVPAPHFHAIVPAPVFAAVDVPVVALVARPVPRTPVRAAVKWIVKKTRVCDGGQCRVVETLVPVTEETKPAGDAKPADAQSPASAGPASGCAGGVCRPALRRVFGRR